MDKSINDIMTDYQQALTEGRKCKTCDNSITPFKDMEGIIEFGKTGQCKQCQMVGGLFIPRKSRNSPLITQVESDEMNEEVIREKAYTGAFVTDSKTDFVDENDRLELEVLVHINVHHPEYEKFILALSDLLRDGRNESGLIVYMSGVS